MDYNYLLWAYHSGGATIIGCPEIRASLQRAGYMEPCSMKGYRHYGADTRHGMALTKKGQKRAEEIIALRKEANDVKQSNYRYKRGPKFQWKAWHNTDVKSLGSRGKRR